MKLRGCNLWCVAAAFAVGWGIPVSRGQTGSAVGTARELAVEYAFELAAAFRPSTPAGVQVAVAADSTLTLSWLPSLPSGAGRTIAHYDVLRNGVKVAQTPDTLLSLSLDPASPVLEFYAVRAIDNLGLASAASAEVLLPRSAPGVDGDTTIETKVVLAERIKGGIRGLLTDRRFKRGSYAYHRDQVRQNYDLSSTSTREDRSFAGSYDPETGLWRLDAANGSYTYEQKLLGAGASASTVTGTWLAGDGYPPAAELRAPDGSVIARWPLHGSAFRIPEASSETNGQFIDPDEDSTTRVELSDELTESEFRAGIDRDFATGQSQSSLLDWNSWIRVSHGEVEQGSRQGRFRSVASRVEYDQGDTITLTGSVYRLHFSGSGVKTFRWIETTTFDNDDDPVITEREETIDLDHSDGFSRAYSVMPPDFPGSTDIQMLSAEMIFEPRSQGAAPGSAQRLYAAAGVMTGGLAEITISVGTGWLSGVGTSSAVLSMNGTEGALRLVAIDPMLEASDGLDAAIAAGQEVAVGTDLLLDPNLPGFPGLGGRRLVALGLAPGKADVQVTLTNSLAAAPTLLSVPITVYPAIRLAADVTRDGQIRLPGEDGADLVSSERPFRYWINDDADAGDANGEGDVSDGSSSSANYRDEVVNGNRDLVDFFPVFLDLRPMLAVLPPSASVKYRLRQADGAVNFVYTDRTRAQALAYQTQLLPAGFGDRFDRPPSTAETHRLTEEGCELSAAFLAQAANADGGVILVEGRHTTNAPLVLTVESDGVVLAEGRLELRLNPVESMFRHVDLTRVAKAYDGRPLALPTHVPATRTADPGDAWPDSETNSRYFVFIHGFNIDGQTARGWHAEVFKRLHVLGSRARFVGVTWHGATGVKLLREYTDYHQAVFNAFQTGDALAGSLAFTQGADVTVAAHSLGNIVASQAIQSGGLSSARYFMINAAVPLEAYDLDSVTSEQRTRMTESKWKSGVEASAFAANWHGWFSANLADSRGSLKWKERFKSALGQAYNFYSTGDEVVEDPEWDSPSMLKLVLTQGFNFSRGAWTTQEFAKGATFMESAAVAFLSRVQGGWGQSVDFWPVGPSLRSLDQTKEPYFGYFLEHELFDADARKASAMAMQPKVGPDLLARGIPAMSFAAATHPLIALGGAGAKSLDRNVDLEADGRKAEVWPIEGHTIDRKAAGRWLHSDFKNVALPYVYPMYQLMFTKGELL